MRLATTCYVYYMLRSVMVCRVVFCTVTRGPVRRGIVWHGKAWHDGSLLRRYLVLLHVAWNPCLQVYTNWRMAAKLASLGHGARARDGTPAHPRRALASLTKHGTDLLIQDLRGLSIDISGIFRKTAVSMRAGRQACLRRTPSRWTLASGCGTGRPRSPGVGRMAGYRGAN